MPPSPALRCSPGREPRTNQHRRGRSFESGMIVREKDEDLALFNEMQTREKEDFLLQSDDLEDTFCKMKFILRFGSNVKFRIFFSLLTGLTGSFMFLVLQLRNSGNFRISSWESPFLHVERVVTCLMWKRRKMTTSGKCTFSYLIL